MKKNIPYYLILMVLFILLKLGYKVADNDQLGFLLKPTDKFVGVITSSQSVYLPESGYYHEQLNIVIDKSCSGFNFWLLTFALLTFLSLKYLPKHSHKAISIPASLVFAYVITIFTNTSRIVASILIQSQSYPIMESNGPVVHEAIGIVTNLTFLILIYYITERTFIKLKNNAKLT